MYWFFTRDNSGDFVDTDGNRYIAHSSSAFHTPKGSSAFHTPKGLNVGCPEAETAEEAGAVMGLTYEPLPKEEETEQPTI